MNKILIVDQGTTSSRAMLFTLEGKVLAFHQIELKPIFPHPGWVEQNPEEIWDTVKICCRQVLKQISLSEVIGLGITNQRETTLVWDRETGECLYNAIVWQDRRTSGLCEQLKSQGIGPLIYEKTGLLLDPYFSATKIMWVLQNSPGGLKRAKQGKLLFGTIDCYLLWRLTKGKVHSTDITNASRTLLFNINQCDWDDELIDIFSIPREILPKVKSNCELFGLVDQEVFGEELPVLAMMGDQQAAMIGQGCLNRGAAKCTYGTGAFLMIFTGEERVSSEQQLINTIASKINNQISYAIEGSVFAAGTIVKWFKDTLHLIHTPQESEAFAKALPNNGGVYLVPAFTGLGAPYWTPNAKGAIYGLTRDTTPAHIVRAGLEAIVYQTKDLLLSNGPALKNLRVDGGVTANSWLMQFLADILQIPITVSSIQEATALGMAALIGYCQDYHSDLTEMVAGHKASELMYFPQMAYEEADELYSKWRVAVSRTCSD